MCLKLWKARTKHFVVPAEEKYLARIRDFTTKYAKRNRFSRKEISSLKSSIDEICSNIVRYAYEGIERGDIRVRIQRRKNLIIITISDTGVEFDPSTIEAFDLGRYVQERRSGGMGFHLVKELNDEVLYDRVGNQNVITIRRKIGPTVRTTRA